MNMSILEQCVIMFKQLESLPLQQKVKLINEIRIALHAVSPMKAHPIDLVLWEPVESVKRNDYNPNSVAPTELKLLETSIHEDGYTQPIVTWVNENQREIVDGFHRSKVAKESEKVASTLHGFVPVTTVRDKQIDKSNRMASTIRHNRARGTHSVDAMSEIVLELKARNWKTARICKELGMEEDEVDQNVENLHFAPSWRRVAKTLLRNDYWCKGLGFSQPKSEAYDKYLALKGKIRTKAKPRQWGEN